MTPELLAAIAGAVLSFLFAYFPWLKDQFDKVPGVWKPILNAGILLVVALGLVGASCLGVVTYFACSLDGVYAALYVWVLSLIGNRLAYNYGVRKFKRK